VSFGPASPDAGVELLRQLFLQCRRRKGNARMPTSFGGRRNFTSWGVTLFYPTGAEHIHTHSFIQSHSFNSCIHRHSLGPLSLSISSSLVSSEGKTTLNRLCGILFNRFYRLEIHSLMVDIFDPACELLPPWTKEIYLCTVAHLQYLLSDLLPHKVNK
jgi:hypothetical protein